MGRFTPPISLPTGVALKALVLTFVMMLSLVVTGLATAEPAAAVPTPRGNEQIRGLGGNCLTAASTSEFAKVTMQKCDGRRTQNWYAGVTDSQIGGRRIHLAGSSHCLTVTGNSKNNGVLVRTEFCGGGGFDTTQLWAFESGPTEIRNVVTNRCLDVQWGNANAGASVWQYDCNGSAAQRWVYGEAVFVGDVVGHGTNCLTFGRTRPNWGDTPYMSDCTGTSRQDVTFVHTREGNESVYYIMMADTCLDRVNGSYGNGVTIQAYGCYKVDAQQWTVGNDATIRSRTRNVCLDVAYRGTSNGTKVWGWTCNNTEAQGWWTGTMPEKMPRTGAIATQWNVIFASRLGNCSGMVNFEVENVHVVAMKNPAPFVVQRTGSKFTDAAKSAGSGWTNRAAINGPWFGPAPDGRANVAQGDIYSSFRKVNTHPYNEHFYFVAANRTGDCAQWYIGPNQATRTGAAPPSSSFAVGGARPLIIEGTKWGLSSEGLQDYFGNNLTFGTYQQSIQGKPTMGVRNDGVVLLMVQDSFVNGTTLTTFRDGYANLGFRDAILWDPNTSATLAVNGRTRVTPTGGKDSTIPYGLAMASR